jgi:hypothetical protein
VPEDPLENRCGGKPTRVERSVGRLLGLAPKMESPGDRHHDQPKPVFRLITGLRSGFEIIFE